MTEAVENPICVDDMGAWFYWKKHNKNIYVIGSKEIDKYFMLEEEKRDVILYTVKLMDGSRTIAEIDQQIKEKFKIDLDVQSLVARLKDAGLLEKYNEKVSNELDLFSKSLFDINFNRISNKKRNVITVIWNILFVISIGIILVAVFTIMTKTSECREYFSKSLTYKGSYVLGAILAAGASIFNIILHECSHAITSVRCGLQPSNFRMTLYGGFKFLWMVKIKGMYTIKRFQRIMVMGAGVYTNFVLICLSLIVCIWGMVTGSGSEIISKIMINNVFMILACSMPFNISDGYYIISQLTKRINMRKKMFRMLNFKKDSFRNTDIWDILYAFVSVAMIIYSFYLTGIWCFHIALEVYGKATVITHSGITAGIVASVPVLFILWFDFIFIRRFIRLIKANA